MKWNRNDRGQAVLEFAMVLPLFLLVMVGTAEVGTMTSDSRWTAYVTGASSPGTHFPVSLVG